MRIAIIGQQSFGKAVLDAFLARGDEVAAVFCAPEKPGARPDPLRVAAQEQEIKLFQLPNLKDETARTALRDLDVDLGVMAYVLQFVPQSFVNIPRHGMIQYHPSLLPRHRGPSSINWAIISGESETGLTIFRPTDGLDEGPVILQKTVAIGPEDTVGSVYFQHLYPLGVEAITEAADLILAGRHSEEAQDENTASYEGWCREAEARIDWSRPLDQIHNLIRGCDPAPGAWTVVAGQKVQLFAARKHPVRRYGDVPGKPGRIVSIGTESIHVAVHGGMVEIGKVRTETSDGKIPAADFAHAHGLKAKDRLESRTSPAAAATTD